MSPGGHGNCSGGVCLVSLFHVRSVIFCHKLQIPQTGWFVMENYILSTGKKVANRAHPVRGNKVANRVHPVRWYPTVG